MALKGHREGSSYRVETYSPGMDFFTTTGERWPFSAFNEEGCFFPGGAGFWGVLLTSLGEARKCIVSAFAVEATGGIDGGSHACGFLTFFCLMDVALERGGDLVREQVGTLELTIVFPPHPYMSQPTQGPLFSSHQHLPFSPLGTWPPALPLHSSSSSPPSFLRYVGAGFGLLKVVR